MVAVPIAATGGPNQSPLGTQPSPANLLMAAADLHNSGPTLSAPVPTGVNLQTGHKPKLPKQGMRVIR